MKKLICLLLALLFCVSLAACGEKSSENGATKDSADSAAATAAPVKQFATVEDYLNNPQVQERIKEQSEGDESVVKMAVYAQDDTLVYEDTYVDHFADDQVAAMKERIDSALSDSTSTEVYGDVVEELRQYVNTENPKVKVSYLNDDGSLITEKVFE